ncbi:MAG TPA: SAM-dependent methyltransferase [Pirellulales bacterium]|nr:SAM-dependent methyltransferase [Pirellulales bacterium]
MTDEFLFCTCQIGAEPALKAELARVWPGFRFAYSRPGFLTFKSPIGHLPDDFDLGSVFARSSGLSLGRVSGDDAAKQAAVWQLAGDRPYRALHVWPRDTPATSHVATGPSLTPECHAIGQSLLAAHPAAHGPGGVDVAEMAVNQPAAAGQLVLDVILVEPNQWWIGFHRAHSIASCWPGGILEIALPAEAVSRAWLKMEEALAWSALPIRAGEHVVEIGCSPGGASQALLAHGLRVTGIDPADVDPAVLAHRHFTHLRMRGADVRRREFRDVRWLVTDMNVAPSYTLTTVEQIVTHPGIKIAGLLITLKLIDWHLAEEIPAYLDRVRSWGYPQVAARQLSHNRQEICVAASRAAGSKF